VKSMNKKILGIVAIMTAALFLLTPISAMSSISTMEEKPTQSVIPQSEFVITLGENEEVTWTADYVTRDDDVAYVTVETNIEADETGELQIVSSQPPQPLIVWPLSHRITAKNWWGRPLFYTWAKGWASFVLGKCTGISDTSIAGTLSMRYGRTSFNHYTEGIGQNYAKIVADSYWIDKLMRRTPHIHVWAKTAYPSGGGYLEWDS